MNQQCPSLILQTDSHKHTSVTFVDGRSEALVAMVADPCPSVNKQAGMNNCGDGSWQARG